ncbi:MAG TPA: FKBP-type peptidyl-prolyl cis-trans isomerase [Candidatus Nanopelagicales bacterium]
MPRRITSTARALALSGAALVLLAGCWTASASDSGAAAEPAQPQASSAASAPEPACPAGTADADSYECVGVTVAGAKDAAPTIELAQDFGPASQLQMADVYQGGGAGVQPGDTLTVNYVGVGQSTGQVFDSSWERGQPATFPLDNVIPGWQQGMVGMQPGGRRLLVIPGDLAYGANGTPDGAIKPDETLVFVVDLISAQPAG